MNATTETLTRKERASIGIVGGGPASLVSCLMWKMLGRTFWLMGHSVTE